MAGIIQEQHPDRCRLFMQWKQMDWPILTDSLNRLEVTAVPITLLIDEHGIIRKIRPTERDLKQFVETKVPEPKVPEPKDPPKESEQKKPDFEMLLASARAKGGSAWGTYANALVEHGRPNDLSAAIAAYERARKSSPNDGWLHFRLGVAFRKRYDSAKRMPNDFSNAIKHWSRALEIDPNQYIWRRRIQQYGPRLDKPYPFYDWVPTAREEITKRGETPAALVVEPRGAEFASPQKNFASNGIAKAPDPKGRINRDTRNHVKIEAVSVPSTKDSQAATRVHLTFSLNSKLKTHWNNEAEGLTVWINQPSGWSVNQKLHEFPNPPEATSLGSRRIEFEAVNRSGQAAANDRVDGYALYYVCEDVDGVCLYLRQDFSVVLVE